MNQVKGATGKVVIGLEIVDGKTGKVKRVLQAQGEAIDHRPEEKPETPNTKEELK